VEDKMVVHVRVDGCDDSTVFDIDATAEEFAFLKRVAAQCTASSSYRCMPVMSVIAVNPPAKELVEG
jgi:hypothetical protein